MTFAIATPPSNGKVSLTADTGAFTYTPNLQWSGNDSFTFKVSDDGGTTWSANTYPVNITVVPSQALKRPLLPGRTAVFEDADGSRVSVRLSDRHGYFTLTNGGITGAAIDTIVLEQTTQRSSLAIISRGGSVAGSSIANLIVHKAAGAPAAFGRIAASRVDFAGGGRIEADGSVKAIILRDVGAATGISITGSLGAFTARNIGGLFNLTVTDDLTRFSSASMGTWSLVSAGDGIGNLSVTRGILNTQVWAGGASGIGRISVGCLTGSLISSRADIETVTVNRAMYASSIAANIGPGPDGLYGTADDVVMDDSLGGAIRSMRIKGTLIGSANTAAEHFGVVAYKTIGSVTVHGSRLTLPALFGNICVAHCWR